jgi:hypothetical protein
MVIFPWVLGGVAGAQKRLSDGPPTVEISLRDNGAFVDAMSDRARSGGVQQSAIPVVTTLTKHW